MMKNLYSILRATLIVFVLTACQAAPIPATATHAGPTQSPTPDPDFFKSDATRWITINPPAGWLAKEGGTTISPLVMISNDWPGYTAGEPTAIAVVVTPLDDKGSAADVLQVVIKRFSTLIKKPTSELTQEQVNGQSYASIEYEKANTPAPASYLITVISNGKRNVLVFTAVFDAQKEETKPTFQSIVKGIILH